MQGYNFAEKQTYNVFDTVRYVIFTNCPNNPLKVKVHNNATPLRVERIAGEWTMLFDVKALGSIMIKLHDCGTAGYINGFKVKMYFKIDSFVEHNDTITIGGSY